MSYVDDNIPEGWVETTLGEVSTRKQYGYTESASLEEIGPKFLRITDIQNDYIDWKSVPYCPIKDSDYEKYKLEIGDVVIARTGNSTGATATIKEKIKAVFASYLIRFQINKEIANYNFIDFLVRSKIWYGFVNSVKSGSAQGGANANDFALFPINLPPLPEQKAIAKVLTAFDDKIENLREQNKTLEQTAQTLFKEWFGNYQIDDELPEGWRVGKLEDLLTIKYGKDHKHLADGEIPLYGSGGIMRFVEKSLYNQESILIPRKGTLSNLFYLTEPFWSVDTMFYTEIKKSFQGRFTFHFLKCINLSAMDVGSAVPSLTTQVLKQIPVIIPKDERVKEFNEIVSSFYQKIKKNNQQIHSLIQIRDTLLPKLMSGEIRTKEFKK